MHYTAKGSDRIRILRQRAKGSAPFSGKDYVVDLDPTHRVLRITVTTTVTDQGLKEYYRTITRLASRGGPYAAITDFSQVVDCPVSTNTIRELAATIPAVPGGRPRVIVAPQTAVYGLARMFELHRNSMGGQFHVVRSMGEAYDLLKVTPQDFTQRLFPEEVAV
jgi:hypothetical protein